MFPDLAEVSSATVTVKGAVAPSSVSFSAINTAYTFDKGDADAKITIPNANFAPSGDVTFNVPVQISATTFTNLTGCALTFNAPFGQTIDATSGYCTNLVTISPYGTLTVAPGAGKTQTFDTLNNQNGGFSSNATFRVGEGKVRQGMVYVAADRCETISILRNVQFGMIFVEDELLKLATFVEAHDGLVLHGIAADTCFCQSHLEISVVG